MPFVEVRDVAMVLPFPLPISRDGFDDTRWAVHCDDTQTTEKPGIKFRDLRETMPDMVRCMHESGRLPTTYAGRLAASE